MIVSTNHIASLLGMPWREIERIAAKAFHYYEPFDYRKIRGTGKWRHIDNPMEVLKKLQSKIYEHILLHVPMPDSITGGVRGRSVRDHTGPHVRQPVLVTLDIRNCFPRISRHDINRVYRRLGYSPTIARVLTQLTTVRGALPQGAPTSPALANLALLDLHRELLEIAGTLDLNLSQYVDDIAISGSNARAALEPSIAAIMRHGHSVRRRKVVVANAGVQQRVTGTVVNSGRSVEKKYRENLYARIHRLAAEARPLDAEIKSVLSAIAHVERTNSIQGAVLRNLADRILPQSGVEGSRTRLDEYQACSHRRRCREERRSSRDLVQSKSAPVSRS